jgi:predicted extracellular nuclease
VVDGAYTTANAPRMGDTVSGLTGVLDFDFNEFRVRSIENGPGVNDFTSANPRPAAPADVGGTLKVASFNVLNYFTTLDERQAHRQRLRAARRRDARRVRPPDRETGQRAAGADADVIGLNEIENNFKPGDSGNAIEFLVAQLNARPGPQWDWVRPGWTSWAATPSRWASSSTPTRCASRPAPRRPSWTTAT